MRIVHKLIIVFWLVAMIPIFIGSIVLHNAVHDIMVKDTLSNPSSIVNIKKEQVKRFINIQYSVFNGIVNGLDFESAINNYEKTKSPNDIVAKLKKAHKIGPSFNSVFLLDKNGKMIASSNDDEINYDYSSFDFFKNCCDNNVLNDFRLDVNGDGQFFIGSMISDKYYIGARISANRLQTLGGSAGLGDSGEVFIVKPDSNSSMDYITPLRFAPDAVLIGKNVSIHNELSPAVKAFEAKDIVESYDGLNSYNNESVLSAVTFLTDEDLGIVAQITTKEVYEQFKKVYIYFGLIGLIIAGLVTVASISLARSIARPIETLTKQVQSKRTLNSNSQDKITIDGGGIEVSKLAQEFSETFTQLHKKEKELESINETLTQKVNEEVEKRAKNEIILNKLFVNMPIGVAMVSATGKFIKTNDYFAYTLGYTKEEVLEKYASDIIGSYMPHTKYTENISIEKILTKKDNSPITTYCTFSHIGDELFIAYVNISEQKKLIENAKKAETLLIQQSKLAAMGEMIGNIAHQWRQPIAAINAILFNLTIKAELGDVDSDDVSETVDGATKLTAQMSRIIDDFMNFFAPSKAATTFNLQDVFNDLKSLIGASFDNSNISLLCSVPKNINITGYKNELEQVILNLLGNAKDAYLNTMQQEKVIQFYLDKSDSDFMYICVEDKAGGIDEAIIDRVFEPYYTTKPQGKGTGIGLYMSKVIVENSFKGELCAHNIYENGNRIGVKFIIKIPKGISWIYHSRMLSTTQVL